MTFPNDTAGRVFADSTVPANGGGTVSLNIPNGARVMFLQPESAADGETLAVELLDASLNVMNDFTWVMTGDGPALAVPIGDPVGSAFAPNTATLENQTGAAPARTVRVHFV